MDNAPRAGYPAYDLKGSDVCWVDLAGQQALTAKCMSKMFKVLGNEEKAEFYKSEQKRINDLINQYHWHEKSGYYYDFFGRHKATDKVKWINTKTAAAFWTLLCGAAEENEKLIPMLGHLMNPEEFYTHTPFASLSKDDLNYDPTGGYWLGSSWHPTTFAAIRGLSELGQEERAREAAMKLLDVMSAVNKNENYGGIWECYAPEADCPATRENGEMVVPNFVGWGGLGPVTMLIENIIGLKFDASKNEITYRPCPDCKSGLKNMIFNGGKVDIECVHYSRKHGDTEIHVQTEKPIVLQVWMDSNRKLRNVALEAGSHTLKV